MSCPVCGSEDGVELLALDRWPLYQHPVPAEAEVDPVYCDIEYLFCTDCGHAYQSDFRRDLLEKLYQLHYYAPGFSHIGYGLREQFATFFSAATEGLRSRGRTLDVLEIGSSSGEMLGDLLQLHPDDRYCGFEPNQSNAAAAEAKNIETEAVFLTTEAASRHGRRHDVIFSRHVIEHVFDFDDFFAAINRLATADTRLILETPMLDRYLELASFDPFHIEHIHVFSLNSLVRLANRFGWGPVRHTVTTAGNVIVLFGRNGSAYEEITPPDQAQAHRMMERVERWRERVDNETLGRRVLIWGAGSYGRKVVTVLGLEPEMFLDGNPNKEGWRYVGLDAPVRHAPPVIKDLIEKGEDKDYAVIVASTFFEEIERTLGQLGWGGKVITLTRIE